MSSRKAQKKLMPSSRFRRPSGAAAALVLCSVLLLSVPAEPAWADTPREQQWFLDAMKADEMWRTSTGAGMTVAVIDTGVNPKNPNLAGQVLAGKDFALGEPGDAYVDYEGHGTSMATLIAGKGGADDGKAPSGLAPGAKILPIRMPKAESANNQADASEKFNRAAHQAIRYAADQNAKIINISMGTNAGSPELTAAVKYALDKGSLVFAAVGNSGNVTNEVEYPGATPGVVGVSAVGRNLHGTPESEFGPQVDMSAPGDEIVHACDGGTGLCESHGTSDATALASASAALIWSKHPTWTNNQVLRVMLNTIGGPTDGAKRNDSIGFGIVRPRIALVNPGDPGPADVYPLPDPPTSGASAAPATPSPAGTPSPAATPGKAGAPQAEKLADSRATALLPMGFGALGVIVVLLGLWLLRKHRLQEAAAQAQQPSWGHGAGWPENQSRDHRRSY
ncbi:type VII secretion-associated serine protease mycosin [Streptomyces sp. NBC_00442]|uniref:type VII secretion-associated serine protease mycosin n=1 Tax=Streptomyces sp. NBC_00442 TaxID=2903651 RepID=UPI002E22506F